MKAIPDFKTAEERQAWFIANADYFTTITRLNRTNIRCEHDSLLEAEHYAHKQLDECLAYRSFLIYAVVNNSDTFVKSVLRTNDNHGHARNH